MRFTLSLSVLLLMAAPAIAQEHDHSSHPNAAPVAAGSQTTCPVSGEALEDHDLFVDYEGQRIYLCCKKCIKKFQSFPDQFIAGMKEPVQNIQKTCPVSGEALDEDAITLTFGNKTLKVCCKKCTAKVNADPAAYFDKLEGRTAQEKCAVRGGKVKAGASFVVNGSLVDQCCPGCEEKFEAEPAKYFGELQQQKVVLQPASDRCPVMPKMAVKNRNYWVTYGSQRFYFCSEGTRQKFLAEPAKYIANLKGLPLTGPPPPAKLAPAESTGEHSEHGGHAEHGSYNG